MKLGHDTGSVVNYVLSKGKAGKPIEVGMGATELMWSDRHAYTVVKVESQTKVWVQKDHAKVVIGQKYNGSAKYEYTPNLKAPIIMLTLRKDGQWHQGTSLKGQVFAVGYREEYYDPSF
jgi:hypothetical protein